MLKCHQFRQNLFQSKKELLFFAFLLLFIFLLSFTKLYQNYKDLTRFDTLKTKVIILSQSKRSWGYMLKLKSEDGFLFLSSTKENIKNLQGFLVEVKLFPKKLSFLEFLKEGYIPSYITKVYPHKNLKTTLSSLVKAQHQNKLLTNFYSALFFAEPILPALRKELSKLGINHLIAISGYHISFLSLILFSLFKLPYSFFQKRFFPFRNNTLDLISLTLFCLFCYLYLLDFPPSLLRAFVMSVFVFFFYQRQVQLLSFSFLLFCVLLLLALFPKLIFSLSFWFSVAGVFYIYLFLQLFPKLSTLQTLFGINFFVFLTMLPLTLFFFHTFSFAQILSPLLTLAFSLFYPLVMLLHFLNIGYLLDNYLLTLILWKIPSYTIIIPKVYFVVYLLLSLLLALKTFFKKIV